VGPAIVQTVAVLASGFCGAASYYCGDRRLYTALASSGQWLDAATGLGRGVGAGLLALAFS